MKARTEVCKWCEREYAIKDSTAKRRDSYCSAECEEEHASANKECKKWFYEIKDAWREYEDEYVPSEDEGYGGYDLVCYYAYSKRHYLAFKARYLKWKENHCWKVSFWKWDGSSPSSFSGGGSGCVGGIGKAILKVVGFVLVVWLGWKVVCFGWNLIFGGGREVDPKVEMVKSWKKHIEQRCEAFDDGMPEREVEAKGLRNYSWTEWQEKCRTEQPAAEVEKQQESGEKEMLDGVGDFISQRSKEIGVQAKSAAKGIGDKAKNLWRKVTK